MAVFNCSTYEADEINETVDFNVQTQTNNLYTGGFPVTDTLKIKGINGVNVVARDNTILIGVDGTGSTGGNTDGGNTDGGNTDGGGVDTTLLELSVEALGQRVETLEQSVETLSTDLQALSDRVSDLESGDGTGGGSTGGSTGGNTGGSNGDNTGGSTDGGTSVVVIKVPSMDALPVYAKEGTFAVISDSEAAGVAGLPPLPEYDTEKHRGAVVIVTQTGYELAIGGENARTLQDNGDEQFFMTRLALLYRSVDGGEWEPVSIEDSDGDGYMDGMYVYYLDDIVWTNADHYGEGGVFGDIIYPAASEYPVGDATSIHATLAVRKGRVWYVCDGTGGGSTGGSAGGSGCTCPDIYTANSVAELPDPATVPKNSLGLVPSSEKITLKSPNGTVYLITVSDDGEVSAEAV